jgi:predicted nucleic acid-binding protein
MGEESIVCDTSLLLYLGRIKKVTILSALYKEVYVPEKVALELDAGRLLRADTIDPRMLDWVNVVSVSEKEIHALPPNQLGIGEQSVIAYTKINPEYLAGLDDRLARLFAEQLGIKVVGMIGVLIKAKNKGLLPSLHPLLESVRTHGFRMSKELHQEALSLAGEEI